ncbi:MAG: XRE family transcriptional regulator [Planctomycetota bacterium]|nr:MAG: XRE family transcriptional regulator [Planctomycetota bacterium]
MSETPPITSLKVGERIRQIRREKKISMKELAKMVGVSFSYIAKIETGQNRIHVEKLHLIANALRTSMESLLAPDDVDEEMLKKRGWYTLRDFYCVHYDHLGRPKTTFYNIQNREANLIGQLRDLEKIAPEIAQEFWSRIEEFTQSKDPNLLIFFPKEISSHKKRHE